MVEGQGYISPPYRKFSRPDMDSPTGNGSLFFLPWPLAATKWGGLVLPPAMLAGQ